MNPPSLPFLPPALRAAPLFVLFLSILSSCASLEDAQPQESPLLQGAGVGIHGLTLIVEDLDSTLEYYREVLGFQVMPNQVQAGPYPGTRTAQILSPGLTSLEFLARDDSANTRDIPSFLSTFLAQGEGPGMYAISSSSTEDTYAWLSSQGFSMDSVWILGGSAAPPEKGGWRSGSGMFGTKHRLSFDRSHPSAHLPHFEEYRGFDYAQMEQDWKTFFSMGRSYLRHPNGVVGVLALQVAVEELASARSTFQQMGFVELPDDPTDHMIRFRLKRNQELQLMTSQSSEDEIAQQLTERGPGVFGVIFEVKDLAATRDSLQKNLPADALRMDTVSGRLMLNKAYAHGLQMQFQQEDSAQTLLAQQLVLGPKLDSASSAYAAELYTTYCALCHGEEREGYAADFAPSLRSHSLMATTKSSNFLRYTVQYGRANTAMGGYMMAQGGPLGRVEIDLLLQWLYEESGVEAPVELSREPVPGDIALGREIYTTHCASCHGDDGEGLSAPALGNPMLLATATDEFLRYAITEGRDGTPMVAFKDSLDEPEIAAVTAFLRSRASGWDVPQTDSITIPEPEDYILHPDREAPAFDLREGRYVSAKQVYQALQDSARLVLLDARSTVAWRQLHIPGAIPVPYYEEPEEFVKHIPNDDHTWIVAYCACPHAASGQVVDALARYGYKNTAILDEGILVWAQLGYPVVHGQ